MLTVAKPSEAADITFLFTGAVSSVPSALNASPDNLHIGPMTGSITFDGDALGTISNFPNLDEARYPNAITAATVTIPMGMSTYTASWVSGTLNTIVVLNATPGNPDDRYVFSSNMDGGTINGLASSFAFDKILLNSTETAFNSTDLPISPPSLSLFDLGRFQLHFTDGTRVEGAFSDLKAVPLPPAVILFGAGLIALIGLGARNWRLKGSSVA